MSTPRWFAIIFLVLALAGFLDSVYLTAEHLRGVVPPCTVVSGCERVLTSSYSQVFGIPVAAFGALYYGLLIGLLIAFLESGSQRLMRFAFLMTFAGLAATVYFLVIQAFILSAYCFYCLISAAISSVLFILGITGLVRYPQLAGQN